MNITDFDSDDEPTELENLFASRDPNDDIFYFRMITVNNTESSSEILFHYNFSNEIDIESKIVLDKSISDKNVEKTIISIGMCILTWYWMGYGCPKIVLERKIGHVTDAMLDFWKDFYKNILLEFVYMNKGVDIPSIINETSSEYSLLSSMDEFPPLHVEQVILTPNDRIINLVPIGGGKDSLVVWHMMMTNNTNTNTKTSCSQNNCSNNNNNNNNNNNDNINTTDSNNNKNDNNNCRVDPDPDSSTTTTTATTTAAATHLLYVSDGLNEFEDNWRLNAVCKTANCPLHIVKHVFHDEQFERTARSYLNPCGHPWAALVMFDALLVCQLEGFHTVCLGYEKSADYGNNLYVHDIE
eukprot:gene12671-26686_t